MIDESIIITHEFLQHSRMSGLIMHGIEQRSFIDSHQESEFEMKIKQYLDYFGWIENAFICFS